MWIWPARNENAVSVYCYFDEHWCRTAAIKFIQHILCQVLFVLLPLFSDGFKLLWSLAQCFKQSLVNRP